LSDKVYARLQGLGTVFKSKAPQSQDVPYLIFQIIAGVEMFEFQGSTNMTNTRVQVDSYALTATEAETLWKAARDAMAPNGTDFICGGINQTGELPELGLAETVFRHSGDFSLWHDIG